MDVSTQLRLITKSEPPARPLRARPTPRRDRRPVHWQGQWRLDEQTKAIGKAGVASARAALEKAHREDADAQDLRQAS
jgi:hypothetical protein